MPKVNVSSSIRIDAPVDRVYTGVRHFEQWPQWSPWLIADPDLSLDIKADQYSWAGQICGVGGMAVRDEERDAWIDYDLVFEMPIRSQAKVRMIFSPLDGGTEVTWTMVSSLPFFFFRMRKSMEAFIEMDFDRGLLMLKSLIETGTVPSRLDFEGPREVSELAGVGLRRTCHFGEMERQLRDDLEGLRLRYPDGRGFCVHEQWEPIRKSVTYFAGVSFDELPANLPGEFESIMIPAAKVYIIRHTGSHQFLGNARAAGMMHARSKQFRHSRNFPPYEIYEDGDAEDPAVWIYLPMK